MIDIQKWSRRAVGTVFRYRVMQILTILIGISTSAYFYLLCIDVQLKYQVLGAILLFGATIEFPLLYLAALRFHFKKG